MKIYIAASRSVADLSSIETPKSPFNLSLRLPNIWQRLLKLAIGNSEVRVWKTQTHTGEDLWHVYEPHCEQSVTFSSEAEVRVWLEQRYYR
jgi:hypothetical protein